MISKRVLKRFFSHNVTPKVTECLINGKFVAAVSGKTFDTFNPTTEQKICSVSWGEKADVDLAVTAATKAFEGFFMVRFYIYIIYLI